jgi:hypothetical protein
MTMGIEAEEVAEGLYGDDGPWERILFWNDIMQEYFK